MGAGAGLVEDEAVGENISANFNTFWGQNYAGMRCVSCRGTQYEGNKILEPGVAGIAASSLGADLTGFKATGNQIMRGNHAGDSAASKFIGIVLGGGSQAECSLEDNTVIQTSLNPVARFTGLELDVTNAGCTISKTLVKSFSSAPYGYLLDNSSRHGGSTTRLSEKIPTG